MNSFLRIVGKYVLPFGLVGAALCFFVGTQLNQNAIVNAEEALKDRVTATAFSALPLFNPAAHSKWRDDEPIVYKTTWEGLRQLAYNQGGRSAGGSVELMTLRPAFEGGGWEPVFAPKEVAFKRIVLRPVVSACIERGLPVTGAIENGAIESAVPIVDADNKKTGVVWVRMPATYIETLKAEQNALRLKLSLLGFGVIGLMGLFARPRLGSDIVNLEEDLDSIADSAQLNSRLAERKGSPFQAAAVKFNTILERFQTTLGSVKKGADLVSNSSQRVSLTAGEVSRMANEVATTIQQVAKGTEDQSSRTSELHTIIQQVSESAVSNRRKAEETTIASEGASEIAQTIHDLAQDAVGRMEVLSKDIRSTAEVIYALGDKSERIGEVVDIIRSIADQTNLLALNAAIEAARAGDAGRGFAVVADEVRKLAEGSAGSADQIATMISEIQRHTQDAVSSMQKGSEGVSEGSEVISRVGAGLTQIIEAVRRTSQLASDISKNAREQTSRASAGAQRIEEINAIAEETAASTEEVAASTEEATASMQELTATSAQLAEMARELQGLVSKFDSRS